MRVPKSLNEAEVEAVPDGRFVIQLPGSRKSQETHMKGVALHSASEWLQDTSEVSGTELGHTSHVRKRRFSESGYVTGGHQTSNTRLRIR